MERAENLQRRLEAQANQHASELEERRLDSMAETSELRSKLHAAAALEQEVQAKLLASERRAADLDDLANSLRHELDVERKAAADAVAARASLEQQLKDAVGHARALEAANAKAKGESDKVAAERDECAARVKRLEAEV